MSIDKIAEHLPAAAVKRTNDRGVARASAGGAATVDAGEAQAKPVLPQEPKLEQIAKQLESYIRSVSRSLEFKVDAASGRTVISVLDAQTGDLIRQIPNEEALRFAQMAEEQTIVLLNETV